MRSTLDVVIDLVRKIRSFRSAGDVGRCWPGFLRSLDDVRRRLGRIPARYRTDARLAEACVWLRSVIVASEALTPGQSEQALAIVDAIHAEAAGLVAAPR